MNTYVVSINEYRVTFVDNNYETKSVTMWANPLGVEEWVEKNHKGSEDSSSIELLQKGPIQEGEPVMTVEELREKMGVASE
jgi:hypothetical protein